ncbi:dehydratase [Rhizobiales bacterium L72]|uniref:Dehydratase n=1 Tax=Propylenella binzhouense TaxID=2555902 RepID=A0A964WVR1_9HYPH|nr:dehydratase [Propylenella binzhouense]
MLGRRFALGATDFTPESIVAFAREYDPQPFHVDAEAARSGPFGALAASGWHTASAWSGCFAAFCRAGGADPGTFLAASSLRWARPVYAGDRIAWDVEPVAIAAAERGEKIVTLRCGGTGRDGARAYQFTGTLRVADA